MASAPLPRQYQSRRKRLRMAINFLEYANSQKMVNVQTAWQLSDHIFFVDAKSQTANHMELNGLSPCEKMHLEHHDERPGKTRVGSYRESSAGERARQSEGIRCGFNPAHLDPSSHAYGTRTNSFSRRPYFRDREASATCREMKLEETIHILHDAGVEFVVIGGAAMALQR